MSNLENEQDLQSLKFSATAYYKHITNIAGMSELMVVFNFFIPDRVKSLENVIIALEETGRTKNEK